jgi:DNA-binding response OmpR family regulator
MGCHFGRLSPEAHYLPAVTYDARAPPERVLITSESGNTIRRGRAVTKRILVVDDKPNLLSLMRMILEDEHYQVSVVQEGRNAIEHVRNNEPDLIILDLKLEDASGLDILQSLKAHSSTADIPVIVYTAAVIEAEEVENLVARDPQRYTGVSVLQKPFDLDALLQRVQAVLGTTELS